MARKYYRRSDDWTREAYYQTSETITWLNAPDGPVRRFASFKVRKDSDAPAKYRWKVTFSADLGERFGSDGAPVLTLVKVGNGFRTFTEAKRTIEGLITHGADVEHYWVTGRAWVNSPTEPRFQTSIALMNLSCLTGFLGVFAPDAAGRNCYRNLYPAPRRD